MEAIVVIESAGELITGISPPRGSQPTIPSSKNKYRDPVMAAVMSSVRTLVVRASLLGGACGGFDTVGIGARIGVRIICKIDNITSI